MKGSRVEMNIEEYEKLVAVPKVSSAQEPNNRGTKWLARLIYVTDADTIVVARFVDGRLQREKVRLTYVDAAEIKHTDGERIVTPYEQALGAVTKNYILNRLAPESFKVSLIDSYKDHAQKKVFDVKPIILEVTCPMTDSKGKEIDLDRYGRNLAAVSVITSENDKGWDITQDLLSKELVDKYEGGTKARSFMKSTAFLDPLESSLGAEIVNQLKDLFKQIPREETVEVTTKTSLPEPRPKRIRRV